MSDDSIMNPALGRVQDVLVNSRLLGHTQHPTITDVPFGAWTATLVLDALEASGQKKYAAGADGAVAVGLVASLIAAAGGLADLSETHEETDRHLGMLHGVLQGITTLLYGGSLWARRTGNRTVGRALSTVGFGTSIASSYLANKLADRRKS